MIPEEVYEGGFVEGLPVVAGAIKFQGHESAGGAKDVGEPPGHADTLGGRSFIRCGDGGAEGSSPHWEDERQGDLRDLPRAVRGWLCTFVK